ncbi:MAG: CRTAC1 family protein [Candidatus Latescibacterota bacterium]|nr:CRTAC1 family protein [Candidatus Latescibacterota bacterium]
MWAIALFLFQIISVSGCNDPSPSQSAVMVARLQEIARTTDPLNNTYLSDRRVAVYKAESEPRDPVSQISFRIRLAKELLQSGYNDEAIRLFEESIIRAPKYGIKTRPTLKEYLALSYLRLGEQQNCVENHNSESCLFPINGGGIHFIGDGARNAVSLYTALFKDAPDNLSLRWLLNIACMVSGQYPEGVPEEALIPQHLFLNNHIIPRFKDRAAFLGVDVMGLAGGVAVDDFNNDGLLDIVTTSWALDGPIHYFRNAGNAGFIEESELAGLLGIVGGLNLRHVDYNNDGNIDLFVLRGGWFGEQGRHPNSLLKNLGGGRFVDVTEQAGLLSLHPTQTACWADFNNDGHLDVFIGNESIGARPTAFVGDQSGKNSEHACELYINQGNGKFVNEALAAGVAVQGFVKGVTWGDYNNDGLMDIYVSILRGSNLLFQNQGIDSAGIPHFIDMAEKAGVTEPYYSFPTWFWDYDNDGLEDIFVAGYRADIGDIAAEFLSIPHSAETPRLFRNNGDGTFQNITVDIGLDRILYAMGCNFGDLDNDGSLDFYVGTGDPDFRLLIPNRIFKNVSGIFYEVTTSGGFGHLQKGHGVAFADFDNDGDQDVYAVMGGAYSGDRAANVLFENPGNEFNWIKLNLRGVQSNRMGVGARIIIDLGDRQIYSRVSLGASFGGNPYRREIGVGLVERIGHLRVEWPSGIVQQFDDVATKKSYTIEEGGELTTQRLLTWSD